MTLKINRDHQRLQLMDNKDDVHTIKLNIIGKGVEVEKMQKRLRCAARAIDTDLHLSWQHKDPRTLNIDAGHAIAVCYKDKLLFDRLLPTEEIENQLIKLKEEI